MENGGDSARHLSLVNNSVGSAAPVGGDDTTSDWVSIPNNENELNRDSHNPYAYPYFHSSDGISSACLLYDLIVEFAAIGSNQDYDTAYSTASANIDDVAMPSSSIYFDISQGRRRLVRRVEARCMTHPNEIVWADSCGDTALHRLAQMARLPSSFDSSSDGTSSNSGFSINSNLNWILKMAKCIISANPAIVLAQNNWKETPLHQFAQHCGLPKEWDVGRNDSNFDDNRNNDDAIDPTWYYETFGRKEWSKKKDSLVEFASLLASRGAASMTNYRRSTALHEAVQLSLVRPSVILHKLPQNSAHQPNHRQIFNVRQQQIQHQKQQFQSQQIDMVHLLIQAAPEAMVGADMYHHTPWMLALQTHHTNPQVLQILLDSEQRHHYNYNQHQIQPRSSVKSLLFRRQASYALSRGAYNFSAGATRMSNRQGDLKDFEESFTWLKTKFIAQQFSDKVLHGLILARVPLHVMSVALKNLPQEELSSVDTTAGCRPLDLLIQQQQKLEHDRLNETTLQQHGYGYTKQTIDEWNDDKWYLSASDLLLKLLTEANPQAASLTCGPSITSGQKPTGPFPLHLALQPKIGTSCVRNGTIFRGNGNNYGAVRSLPWTWSRSLLSLFQAYPVAVGYRDVTLGMFPFQLAAIHAGSDEDIDGKDLENITMIYSLLRAEPSVLKCGN